MPTKQQRLGILGEARVAKLCACGGCGRRSTYKRLPTNFKCVDLICDFCGFLAQVKAVRVKNQLSIPKTVLGAAWQPQLARMNEGIKFALYIVLVNQKTDANFAVYYLPTGAQTDEMFKPRKELSDNAKRKGWQGFNYDLTGKHELFQQVYSSQ